MQDCQWGATLHAHGLLRAGFVPPEHVLFRCAKITEVGGWRVHGWVGAVRESSVNNLKRYQ